MQNKGIYYYYRNFSFFPLAETLYLIFYYILWFCFCFLGPNTALGLSQYPIFTAWLSWPQELTMTILSQYLFFQEINNI